MFQAPGMSVSREVLSAHVYIMEVLQGKSFTSDGKSCAIRAAEIVGFHSSKESSDSFEPSGKAAELKNLPCRFLSMFTIS